MVAYMGVDKNGRLRPNFTIESSRSKHIITFRIRWFTRPELEYQEPLECLERGQFSKICNAFFKIILLSSFNPILLLSSFNPL